MGGEVDRAMTGNVPNSNSAMNLTDAEWQKPRPFFIEASSAIHGIIVRSRLRKLTHRHGTSSPASITVAILTTLQQKRDAEASRFVVDAMKSALYFNAASAALKVALGRIAARTSARSGW
jgi:hypothetical protein